MKKVLITTALALLPFASIQAQSTAVIYGTFDGSIYSIKENNGAKYTGYNSRTVTTSNFGILASENIGNGLTAGARLETELNMSTGAIGSTTTGTGAGTYHRAANVFLRDAKLGGITLGRQITPIYSHSSAGNTLGINSLGFINSVLIAHAVGTRNTITGEAARTSIGTTETSPGVFNNGISYTTPSINGFTASVFTTAGTGASNASIDSLGQKDLAVRYRNNSVDLAVGTSRLYNLQGVGAATHNLAAGSYKFGSYTVGGGLYQIRYENGFGNDIDIASGAVRYQVNPKTSVGVTYTENKDKTNSANKSTVIGVAGLYDFSKRTTVYALAGKANNSGASFVNPIFGSTTVGAKDIMAYSVGLRHSF